MVKRAHESQKLTYRVSLPGEQERLKELVLYVSSKAQAMDRFGLTKLNKIIWRADFTAFAERGVPVTGRAYQRLTYGPAPVEMRPLLSEMAQDGLIRIEHVSVGRGADGKEFLEQRVSPVAEPTLIWFSKVDLQYVDGAIAHYHDMTGVESSDDSHGIAWRTRDDGDPMPYESSLFADEPLPPERIRKILERANEQGWKSKEDGGG